MQAPHQSRAILSETAFEKTQFALPPLLSTLQSLSINYFLLSLKGSNEGAPALISTLQAFLLGATTGFIGGAGQLINEERYQTGESRAGMGNTPVS